MVEVIDFTPGLRATLRFSGESAQYLYWLVFRDLAVQSGITPVTDDHHVKKVGALLKDLRVELEKTRIADLGITDPTLR